MCRVKSPETRAVEFGLWNSDCGMKLRRGSAAKIIRNLKSEVRNGLTLIELLVVIVILMTLVGGVIPVLSPNNEARKIREAARGLQTYVKQAQARAARTGRPVGIAFRETQPGSGVALEVFQIEVAPPFAGFSSASSARFYRNGLPPQNDYTIELGEGYTLFNSNVGQVPSYFVKLGDLIEVDGHLFRLEKDNYRGVTWDRDENGVGYFLQTNKFNVAKPVLAERPFARTSNDPNDPDYLKSAPSVYRIVRQPVPTSESPYTLPAGVAIDMSASGTEGGSMPTLFTMGYPDADESIKQVGIMFSPAGGIDSVHFNGRVIGTNSYKTRIDTPITDTSRILLLLGRVENVLDYHDMLAEKLNDSPAYINQQASDEELAQLQERINWLNLDSRWIAIDSRSGRSVVTENEFVDARNPDLYTTTSGTGGVSIPQGARAAFDQLNACRKIARQMKSGSGR